MRSIQDTGRIPLINEDVFVFGDRERKGRYVGPRKCNESMPKRFHEATSLVRMIDGYLGMHNLDYTFLDREIFAVQDNPAESVVGGKWHEDPVDLVGALQKAVENAGHNVPISRSNADGTIRSLLIDNAKKGKFGSIEDGIARRYAMLEGLAKELLAAHPGLTPDQCELVEQRHDDGSVSWFFRKLQMQIWHYAPGDKASHEAALAAAKEGQGRTNIVIPRAENLVKHDCGFYSLPGSNFCGGCGMPVKPGKDGMVVEKVECPHDGKMVAAKPPIVPSSFIQVSTPLTAAENVQIDMMAMSQTRGLEGCPSCGAKDGDYHAGSCAMMAEKYPEEYARRLHNAEGKPTLADAAKKIGELKNSMVLDHVRDKFLEKAMGEIVASMPLDAVNPGCPECSARIVWAPGVGWEMCANGHKSIPPPMRIGGGIQESDLLPAPTYLPKPQ